MKCAVSVDASSATISSTFLCVFFLSVIRSTQMVRWPVLMSLMCTDKQVLVLVKFLLNGYPFCQIFVADSFGFALLFTFYCSIVVT